MSGENSVTFIIYKATSPSNKMYIGFSSNSLKVRIWNHKKASKIKPDITLYRAFKKYGFDSFLWEVIDQASTYEEAIKKEIMYIELYNTFKGGYNSTSGGDGVKNHKHSEKTKKLLSDKAQKQWANKTDKQVDVIRKNQLKRAEQSKISVVDNKGNVFKSMTEAAKYHNISVASVSNKIKNERKTLKGVTFRLSGVN